MTIPTIDPLASIRARVAEIDAEEDRIVLAFERVHADVTEALEKRHADERAETKAALAAQKAERDARLDVLRRERREWERTIRKAEKRAAGGGA